MAGKLIMTKGLPASGKTTWAMEKVRAASGFGGIGSVIVVCKDDIREELFKKEWSYDKEKEVVRIRDFKIAEALSKGKTVISADTNLAPKHEARLREIAKRYKALFEVKDFTDVPLQTCLDRDKAREASVGEKVIVKMAEEFLKPSDLIARTVSDGCPQLFVDLDGVLADFDGFIEKELGIVNNREDERPDFWDIVRGYKGRLYYDMKPLPGARTLWRNLKPLKPIILTGCPWSIPTAADDKRQWVREQIDSTVLVVCCKSRNKALYGKPGDVLLDDWTKYRAVWEDMGGVFVHYTGGNEKAVEAAKEAMKTHD